MEKPTDLQVAKVESNAGMQRDDHDALINKVALEMAGSQNKDLLSFQKAPENALTRYASAAGNGLLKVPEGVFSAVKQNVQNPLQAVETLGMGAGMAVVLKTVLPEGGAAGKIAAGAIGAYLTYKAAEPVVDGLKQAGAATTMRDMANASDQIGKAGGAFIVDSAIAFGGYKLGARLTDGAMATSAGKSFTEAKNGMYDKIGTKVSDALGITASDTVVTPFGPRNIARNFTPSGYGVIPPYMLQELAVRNPGVDAFAKTHNATIDMQTKPGQFKPNAAGADAAAPAVREVYDAQGRETQPGKKARFEGEKPTGNVEVDNGYDYTGFVRDFYAKEFGRNSIDGKGMKYVSTVNYGQNYENAFWDGKQMTYGKPSASSPFRTFVILDVAGHEITHGVTEMESGMRYFGQSGALNEHLSDVFGVMIEQYSKGHTADKANWIVGENIWKENIKGRGLRDMLNPGEAYNDPAIGKDPQPAHMKDYYKTWGDNGGVHYNSGIPNKAFATFAVDVGGHSWDAPGHIWFEARKNAGSNPSFGSFAAHTLEAAKKLGHTDLVPKLEKAWDNVGVKPDINATDTTTPGGGRGGDDDGNVFRRLFKKAS